MVQLFLVLTFALCFAFSKTPSLIPIQNALSELLIEKDPSHLLVDKTPEGFRRIRAQKRRTNEDCYGGGDFDNDLNNNWGNGKATGGRSERGSYIPYPGMLSRDDALEAVSSGRPPLGATASGTSVTPIELQVTNLDQCVDQKEMKRIITALFR